MKAATVGKFPHEMMTTLRGKSSFEGYHTNIVLYVNWQASIKKRDSLSESYLLSQNMVRGMALHSGAHDCSESQP